MKRLIITNNPIVCNRVSSDFLVFEETSYLGILKLVRDRIHLGYKLLTHPLVGSVKPGETPYRTVVLNDKEGELDHESLLLIESAIETCMKFKEKKWNERILADLQLIDCDLIFGKN